MLSPYDIERIVIGLTIRYGKEPATILMPDLTPDKFVFDVDGSFGKDHLIIWSAICETFLEDRKPPTFLELSSNLSENYLDYVRQLVQSLEKDYLITTYDPQQTEEYGILVDKQGVLYNFAQISKENGNITTTEDAFTRKVKTVKDIEAWVSQQLERYHNLLKLGTGGYTHISNAVEDTLENWRRMRQGEQLVILPCGIPSLIAHQLFPMGKIAVVHGLSSGGKSAFVHGVNLGTAIGMVANKIKGSVAINSMEMTQTDLVERFIGMLAHVDVSKFMGGKGEITDWEMEQLEKWGEFVAKLPVYIDDTNFLTTSALQYRASGLHASERGPVRQLSTDYGELFYDLEGDSEEQRINHVFRQQFALSRMINASILAISQSTQPQVGSAAKSYIAGPDGTRYSRGILQAADILIEVWNPQQIRASGRPFQPPEEYSDAHAWLFVQKYRKGSPAAIPVGWNPMYASFFDMGIDQEPDNEIMFSHLEAAKEALGLGASLLPVEDSPFYDWS